jgi:hypothetical protein
MPLKSVPLAGFLRQAESLCVPNSMVPRPNMPKISAYQRHCSRFLENRSGDLVRLHCVTGATNGSNYGLGPRQDGDADVRKSANQSGLSE